MSFKSGFITIIGKPNVGKSSLLNEILKEKVSIVSPKAQTTRNNILGILNEPGYQMIFTDTPGINTAKTRLDRFMQKSVSSARSGVDVIVVVLDGDKKINQADLDLIKEQEHTGASVIVVLNKLDLAGYDKLLPQVEKFKDFEFVKEIIPTSAQNGKNVDVLVERIKSLLPEGAPYFDEDMYTDQTVRFMVAEIVREKALRLLNQEVPHGIAVEILKFDEEDESLVKIDADIICERKTHKHIIIGSNGENLKKIGISARLDIEELVDAKVFLNLFVKVREDWRDKEHFIRGLGYKSEDN